MKKSYYIFALIAALGFNSCSDDKDEITNLTENVTGTYAGYTVAGCQYFENQVSPDQKVTVTSSSEINKANINFTSSTWGSVTIENAIVSQAEGTYTIKGTGKSVMGMEGSAAKEYACDVTGSIKSGDAAFTFTCPAIMGGLTIEFRQGDIPASIVLPGSYKGYAVAKAAYFPNGMSSADQTINITATQNGSYNVKYISDTWGEFNIDNITPTFTDGVFVLNGNGTTHMGMNGNVSEYACTLAATIDPEKKNPSFLFSVPTVMGGLTIEFFPGSMPE